MKRLTAEQWRTIRQAWEYDPDEPSYRDAAENAAKKHGFRAPSRQAINKRSKEERWERRGSLAGINQAAHRIADRLGEQAPKPKVSGGGAAYGDPDVKPDGPRAEHEERHDAELRRAEIRVRHRKEWEQIVVLRGEALKNRQNDPDQSFQRLKITKIAAETTAIQQAGECRAWGMDEMIDAGRLKTLSDEQLEAIVAGKKIT